MLLKLLMAKLVGDHCFFSIKYLEQLLDQNLETLSEGDGGRETGEKQEGTIFIHFHALMMAV